MAHCYSEYGNYQYNTTTNLAFLPSTDEVVRMYECVGGHLTKSSTFGEDPFKDIPHGYESRKALFDGCQPGWGELLSHAFHGRHDTIQNTLEKCINLTLTLSQNFGI